jgi:hypothetical protein
MRSQEVLTNEVEKARVDEYLAELPDEEYEALTRRVRPGLTSAIPHPETVSAATPAGNAPP